MDYTKIIPKDSVIELYQRIKSFCVSNHNTEDYESLALFSHLFNQAVVVEFTDSECPCHRLETFVANQFPNENALTEMEQIIAEGRCSHYHSGSTPRPLGFYPIHIAAGYGDIDLMNYCLKYGGDIYSTTLCESIYPFDVAVINKHYKIADLLLTKGFKYLPELSSKQKEKLLTMCLYRNELQGVKLCSQAGAKVCESRWKGLMFQAIDRSQPSIVKWLLDLNIGNVNDKIRHGYTALHYVKHEKVAEILLEYGADPSVVVDPVGTPLMLLIDQKRLAAAECLLKFDSSLVDFMVTEAPDGQHNYYSALHYSAWQGYIEGVKLLCRYGADPGLVAYCGNTVLSLACHSDSLPCVELLLSMGCDVNHADKDGDTSLLYATYHGNYGMVEALLEKGAEPAWANKKGTTPLWNAVYSHSLESVKLLLNMNVDARRPCHGQNIYVDANIYDIPVSPLFVAIHHEDLSIAKALIAAGCYINGEKFSTPDLDKYISQWAEDNKRWFEHIASTPPTLAWWCKRTIRDTLLPVKPKRIIENLSIPCSLKVYLGDV